MNEHPSVSALVDVPDDVPAVPVVVVVLELEAVVVVAEVADGSQVPPRSRQPPTQSPRPIRIARDRADTPGSYTPAEPLGNAAEGLTGLLRRPGF